MEHITTFDTDGTEMVTLPRAEYDALKAGYTELNKQLDYLMEQLRLSKKKIYGASSEKTSEEVMEQLSLLFNEAEVYAAKEEADMTTVAAHSRRKKSASVVETLPDLEGFSGWLHADGYQGYHALPENIVVVGCWAHLRRKFDEAVKSLSRKI